MEDKILVKSSFSAMHQPKSDAAPSGEEGIPHD